MAGSGSNDQELLLPFVEHIGYKPANLGNVKNVGGVNVTESEVSANETGKYIDKSKEVEDGIGAPDAVATKSSDISVGDWGGVGGLGGASKIAEMDAVAAKSLDVLVRGSGSASKIVEMDAVAAKSSDVSVGGLEGVGSLGSTTKSATMIIERWETLTISGTRVPMTTNLNHLALAPPPFTSPRLGIGISTPTPTSSMAPRRGLGSLSSLGRAPRTTPRPQVPPQGQKIHCATSKTSTRPFDNTQDLNLYKGFLAANDYNDDL